METENTEVTNTVTLAATETTTPAAPVAQVTKATARKSQKGEWGKVGAPPKAIKYPRGAFTVTQLVTLNPTVCELTLRNRTIDAARGYKIVTKTVNGVKEKVQVPVPQTLVRLEKNASKEGVGRPNFRYMSKAAYDANRKPATKIPKNIIAPSPATPVAAEVV